MDTTLWMYQRYKNGGGNSISIKFEIKRKIKMQEINKSNIEAVLKHNGIKKDDFCINHHNRNISIGTGTPEWCSVSFNNPNWLQIIEAHLDKKLEPLPESNPFDAVKYEQWVKCVKKVHDSNPLSKTIGRWYQKLHCGKFSSSFSFVGDDGGKWNSHCPDEWDLTDIRDYNPDEEIVLAVGDEVVYSVPNGMNHLKIDRFNYDKNVIVFMFGKVEFNLYFEEINNIKSVNGKRGKFVIPAFDFEKTLLDAGFKEYKYRNGHIEFYIGGHGFSPLEIYGKDNEFAIANTSREWKLKPTPQNAKILIELKSKFEELRSKWKF